MGKRFLLGKSYVRSEKRAIRDSEANSCEMKMGCSSDAVAPIREITDPSTINFSSGCEENHENEQVKEKKLIKRTKEKDKHLSVRKGFVS